MIGLWMLSFLLVAGFLAFRYSPLMYWNIFFVTFAAIAMLATHSHTLMIFTASVFGVLLITLNVPLLRRYVITKPILKFYQRVMPTMSRTEKEALAAGTVSWEGDLFTGYPDWQKLLSLPSPALTREEQAFIDGPVETLCNMIDDWKITHELADLPPEMWTFIKANGFFGMIIPKQYGGLGFSAWGHASVLIKLYSRSVSVATTISVPNSLGPAELLLNYGTLEQRDYYLPRLAVGEEIPCFALTAPDAGSDAASIPDSGVVCREVWNGLETLGIRLSWNKRYITLAPVATVLGLAFRLFDPDHILGDNSDLGITCALIPTNHPGVITGRRHFPLNSAFMNGPTQGTDVFIPLDWIIGGPAMAGQGWRMLMECLGAGRAISLPSTAVGGGKAMSLACGAYARVRRQFNTSIGNFEGIEEPLARIAAKTYIVDSAMRMTVAAVDNGAKPSVASAILKLHTTEMSRQIACDAMDIHGGKGICLGPKNYLGRAYQQIPIGITVEGANILTRSLIVFGQGAIRCHPYVYEELEAASSNDLKRFDKALFCHFGYLLCNVVRCVVLAITSGHLSHAPNVRVKRYFQLMMRYSSALAFMAEISMLTLGGNLKRREKLSGRLGDALSYLYLSSSVLKRYHDEGFPMEDLPIVRWAVRDLLFKTQQSLYEVIKNFPNRFVRIVLQVLVFPIGRHLSETDDQLGHDVAGLLLKPSATRDRLIAGIHLGRHPNNPWSLLNDALVHVVEVDELEKLISRAQKRGDLTALNFSDLITQAYEKRFINSQQVQQLQRAHALRQSVIAVDDFSMEELSRVSQDIGDIDTHGWRENHRQSG